MSQKNSSFFNIFQFNVIKLTKYCIINKSRRECLLKKLFIVLTAIVVLRLGSIAYLEIQQLDEPIFLAKDISLDNNALYISYITNRAQPHEIRDVVIDDLHLYPYQETDFNGFISSSNQSNVYVNGRVYSIHAVTFPFYKGMDFPDDTTATIHLKNGMQFEEKVTVSRPWIEQTILKNYFSSSSNDGTGNFSFITEQDVVLTNLTFEQLEDVTLAIDRVHVDIPIKAPIKIPKDTTVEISYKTQIGFYQDDRSEIIFHFLDEHNVPIEIPKGAYKNNPPTSEWIHQYVKERAKK